MPGIYLLGPLFIIRFVNLWVIYPPKVLIPEKWNLYIHIKAIVRGDVDDNGDILDGMYEEEKEIRCNLRLTDHNICFLIKIPACMISI